MVGDKTAKVCADPVGPLLWSHARTGAPCLRDLVHALWEKSIFGHWVRRDNTARREGQREMQNDEGKTGLK
jgi:hypothetical protein